MMRRKEINSITRKGIDATCISNKRGMARRNKRNSAKRLRQNMRKSDLVDDVLRKTEENKPLIDPERLRRDEDWSILANQVVGRRNHEGLPGKQVSLANDPAGTY